MLERIDRNRPKAMAEAITLPSAVLIAGAGAAVAIVAGVPIAAAAAVGAACWAARVFVALPKKRRPERIDVDVADLGINGALRISDVAPPANPPAGFPAILSPTGIQVGDLILLNNTRGPAVGEVTGISNAGGRITFADADSLKVNQSGALNGNIKYIVTGSNTVARRIWAVTYFIEVPQNGQPPRLMRQSGQIDDSWKRLLLRHTAKPNV